MEPADFFASIDQIRSLLTERLGLKGRSLEKQVARLGRDVPRDVARQLRFLAEAEPLMRNPRLSRMVNPEQARKARDTVVAHLKSVDPAKRRADRMMRIAAWVAFDVLVIAAAVVTVLWWRDLI